MFINRNLWSLNATLFKWSRFCFSILLLSLCLISSKLSSQTLYPEITNYAFGSSQNWSIDVNNLEQIAIANNSGLSIYNGQAWTMHQLPKKTIVRSVLCDGDRIYTGSYEEFGFWTKNNLGELKYNSLKELFQENTPSKGEEFWQIIKYKNKVIFRSFGAIYSYDGETITSITNALDISSIVVFNDKLLFGSLDGGLFEIVNDKIQTYNFREINLKSISHLSAYNDLLFVYDTNFGGYLFKGKAQIKLSKSILKYLKDYYLNKITFLNDQTICFGTVKNGIVIYNIKTEEAKIINKQSGIKNNTVLDIKSHNNYLWLALDNGVSKIEINSEYIYFYDYSGVLGTVYDLVYFEDKYYLASNTGVYTFQNNKLKLVENSEGHCWSILRYKNQLYFGHNRGAFVLQNNKLKLIEGSFSGVYNYLPIKNSAYTLVSTYSGIGVLEFKDKSATIRKIAGLDVPVDQLLFENDSLLWATDNNKGLFKIDFNKDDYSFNKITSFSKNSQVFENDIKLERIRNQFYFIIENNWFTYSKSNQKFSTYKDFENKKLLGSEKNFFWVLDYTSSSIIKYNLNFKAEKTYTNKNLVSRFVDNYEKIIVKNDSIRLFNLKDGFAILNLKNEIVKKKKQPKIEHIHINNELLNYKANSVIELKHKQAQMVAFSVFTPGSFNNELVYQLEGELNQTEPILKGKFVLQNLPAGSYRLKIFEKGNPSINKTLDLKILPPWYLSNLLKVFYVLIFLVLLFLVGKYQKRKAQKEYLKAEQKLIEEANSRMELIEKNNLIKEVKSREKELTNRTATIVKKNEVIILLRNELKRLENTSPNLTRTKNILHRSGEQLDSKNDWSLFESKFNELNEDFFKSLSDAYPKLTSKDYKLCAYIKIGLISKEIAPLMGITLRSVELQRYRLRKKLKLDAKITFNEFLRRF